MGAILVVVEHGFSRAADRDCLVLIEVDRNPLPRRATNRLVEAIQCMDSLRLEGVAGQVLQLSH